MTSSGDVVDGDLPYYEPDYPASDDSNSHDRRNNSDTDHFNNDEPKEEKTRKLSTGKATTIFISFYPLYHCSYQPLRVLTSHIDGHKYDVLTEDEGAILEEYDELSDAEKESRDTALFSSRMIGRESQENTDRLKGNAKLKREWQENRPKS